MRVMIRNKVNRSTTLVDSSSTLNLDLHICCQFFFLQVYIFKEIKRDRPPMLAKTSEHSKTKQNKQTKTLDDCSEIHIAIFSTPWTLVLFGWHCSLFCQVVALKIEPS